MDAPLSSTAALLVFQPRDGVAPTGALSMAPVAVIAADPEASVVLLRVDSMPTPLSSQLARALAPLVEQAGWPTEGEATRPPAPTCRLARSRRPSW